MPAEYSFGLPAGQIHRHKKFWGDYSRVISSGGTIFLERVTLSKLSAWCESD
jgi:hypothetical protein